MSSQGELGKNIKKARKKIHLTQAEVAEKAGIHFNYFARIERGEVNPTVEIVENIAKVLKVKSSDLLPF
jgi:transcriptional regulator with XRE-family HTH domain